MRMMGSGPEASAQQKDLMQQLRIFLQGAAGSGRSSVNVRLAATALHLLRNLPGAREAVFEYYAGAFEGMVSRYNPDAEAANAVEEEEEETVVADLQHVLSGFVETSPRAWAPLISKWSLDTLGKLCNQYSNKMCGKLASNSLHEKVSAWLGCRATSFLINISAECLAKLIDTDTESCISALLETSVRHAPHFDWVVAHIGSCFPTTVISRVLSVGLKDFTCVAPQQIQQDGEINLGKVPKLVSAVNIISHLATTHQSDLQRAVHALLLSSIQGAENSQIATVPYVLHLAALSPPLCRALTAGLAQAISQDVIDRLDVLVPSWNSLYFPAPNSLVNLVTHLLITTDRGGPELVVLLLRLGGSEDAITRRHISGAARMMVNLLIAEIFQRVHGVARHRSDELPLFLGLPDHMPSLLKHLLSDNKFLSSSATQILILYALHKGRSVSIQLVKYLLFCCQGAQHLQVASHLIAQVEIFHYNCVHDAVSQSLRLPLICRCREGNLSQLLNNLVQLCRAEQEGEVGYKSSLCQAVRSNQTLLAQKLLAPELTHAVLKLFRLVPPDKKMRLNSIHRLCHCLVEVYFTTLLSTHFRQQDGASSSSAGETEYLLHLTESVLGDLCTNSAGLQIVLRFFLDASINSQFAPYMGGQDCEDRGQDMSVRQRQAARLFKENFRFSSMPVQPLGSSTVFHAGVIGDGLKPESTRQPVDPEASQMYRQAASGTILRLCSALPQSGEGCKQLALLLVEVISPDIMYNGLPWPEDEFMKVTVERDLAIWRLVQRNPLFWTILETLALHRPALCYCSVIIRAIVAVAICHWQSNASSRLTDHPQQLESTERVLRLMDLGQFIPPQLAILPQILHLLDPSQLQCILIDIWNFMRANVPGPNMYEIDDKTGLAFRQFGPYDTYKAYCDRLRLVMARNIGQVGPLFKTYFVEAVRRTENGVTENHLPDKNGETK